MKQIDEEQLETDLNYRYEYLAEFIGFTEADVKLIHQSAGYLAPLVSQIVDSTYEKLLSFDATARHFVQRQHGFDGDLPSSLEELHVDHPQIKFRKEHLSRYLMHLLGRAYDQKMVTYLDMAGKIHTPKAGNKAIHIPLVQMNALMGLFSNLVNQAILGLTLDEAVRIQTMSAFNKLFWIQNDLISRHYGSEAE